MDKPIDELVIQLVACDELHNWVELTPDVRGLDRKKVFDLASPLWIRRMISEGKLLLNPMVIEQLKSQGWIPNDLQKKMIWASIICKLDKPENKNEKSKIRKLIQSKHGNDWWEDVYERAGRVWPAWDRYRKNILSMGNGIRTLAIHSTLVGSAVNDELKAVLKMVPSS